LSFREKIKKGIFVYTVEVEPPKGVDVADKIRSILPLKGTVDAVNVTELQRSVMKLGSLGMCAVLEKKGFETVFQTTGRDKNRLAIQSELLSAYVLGIRNVLVLTGDHPVVGDHPHAKPVFDLDSVQIADTVRALAEGRDLSGNPLNGAPDFFIGAAVNPFSTPLEPELLKMVKKVKAGVAFFQTQPVFEPQAFIEFTKKAERLCPGIRIIAGVMFIKSEKMASYVNENIPGINIPQAYVERIKKAEDKKGEAVNIACDIALKIKGHCSGFHVMPFGWMGCAGEFIKRMRRNG